MKEDNKPNYFRRTNIVWTVAVLVIIFVFIFSMFHLQQRGEYKIDDTLVNYNFVPSPDNGLRETYDLVNSSSEEVNNMIPELEMQYQNATLNSEPYEAQQTGMRLALAYIKIHDRKQARAILNNLIAAYPYDTDFVKKCNMLLNDIK